MHRNQIWLAFLATITLIVLGYSGMTGYRVYNYASLNSKALPTDVNWSVLEHSPEHYILRASYKYQAKNKTRAGETVFKETFYRNRNAAEQAILEFSRKKWTVWYDLFQPAHSTIQKNFPLKSCVYTAILWGLLIYFVWLGFCAGKYQPRSR